MFDRYLQNIILELLTTNPAVVLTGPRQIGKTTFAKEFSKSFKAVYRDLENSRDLKQVKDIQFFTEQYAENLIILDEVQRLPEIFPEIRGIIDRNRRAGRENCQFLFLGSASPDLLRQTSESLAGRISHVELASLNLLELDEKFHDLLWLKGGFPESLKRNEQDSFNWRSSMVTTYLERDIPQFGFRIPAETMRRLWMMLCHYPGGILNSAMLSGSLGISDKTVIRYLDILVDLLLVRRLQPWHTNTKKRLVKSPKIYIRDSGLLHMLLNIKTKDDLLNNPICGQSWEGFVIENLINSSRESHYPYFYRTQAGAEIDLLLCRGITPEIAIDIKLSSNPKTRKGFDIACDDLNVRHRFVVYPGEETYLLKPKTYAVPPAELCGWLWNRAKGEIH